MKAMGNTKMMGVTLMISLYPSTNGTFYYLALYCIIILFCFLC